MEIVLQSCYLTLNLFKKLRGRLRNRQFPVIHEIIESIVWGEKIKIVLILNRECFPQLNIFYTILKYNLYRHKFMKE